MTRQEEVDRNYEAFKKLLPDLIKTDVGRFALMHNQEVVECFDTIEDATKAGEERIEGYYSIQKVTTKPIDLGYFSHASIRR